MSTESAAERTTTDSGESANGATRTPETDEERDPVDLDFAPSRISQGLSFVTALFGAVLTAPFAILAIPFGASGVLLVAGGLVRNSRAWLTAGIALILLGSIVTGAYGAVSPELMLMSLVMILVAWDTGQHGIVLGQQLGRQTRSVRNQLTHTAINALVIGMISATAYVVYLLTSGGRHATAVTLALLGAIIVAWMYRN